MNTPSPAPERRRRRPQALQSSQFPQENATQVHPQRASNDEVAQILNNQHASRSRVSAQPVRPDRSVAPSRGGSASGPLFASLPMPVRLLLIFLCSAIFFTSVVAVTRDYLARQEERRRLEAEAAERAQHPLYYPELITQYAAQQELDPALVCAVVLCESSFDTQAVSRLGARGLMQLMEDTASWIAHRLGEDSANYSFDLLFDAETNIRFGTWYLGYLSRRFDGDPTKIVCAYHAGQGNVDKWLQNPDYSGDGVTLDVIPTEDTAAYASRVLRAQGVYRKYYFPEDNPVPSAPPID